MAYALESMASQWTVRPEGSPLVVNAAVDRRVMAGNQYCVFADTKVMMAMNLEADALRYLLSLPAGVTADGFQEDGFMARLEQDFVTEFSRHLLKKVNHEALSVRRATPNDVCYRSTKQTRHIFDLRLDGRSVFGQVELLPAAINQMVARPMAAPANNLSARRNAIGKERIQLSVNIGQVELPFVELRQIMVGDVLVLNEALTAPIKLSTLNGRKVAEATLGRNEDRIALKINSLATSDQIVKRSIQ